MDRLVLLLEQPATLVAPILVRAVVAAVRARADITLAGIVVRWPKSYPRVLHLYLRNELRRHSRPWTPWPPNLRRLAPLLHPPAGNLNHPDFVARLRAEGRPTLALSLLCGQRFGDELLAVLGWPVNYHNGQLPSYRGLFATSWELYQGAPTAGFAFHRMTAQFDAGPVLLAGALPVTPTVTRRALEQAKARAAAGLLPQLLAAMVARHPGTPQPPGGHYYSAADRAALRTVADPAALPAAERERRCRAFGRLQQRKTA